VRGPRRGVAPGAVLVVVAIVAVSVALVILRAGAEDAREPVRFSGARTVIPMPSLLPPARLGAPVRVALVREPAAIGYYDNPAAFDSIIARWLDAVRTTGADVRVVAPAELAQASEAEVLVVPSSPCLGVETREALERAAGRGQGVILTASTGLYDAGCSHVGYGLTVAVSGATRADTLESRSMVYVTVPGGSALGADLPPGTRIEVEPGAHIALRRAGRDAL
jgi:hypothetical protein